MNRQFPIFTLENECQDCYKCVRHCSVKAIRVADNRASVVPELCIACGICVQICPAKAKQVRNDTAGVRWLMANRRAVFASLAPSWVAEFPDCDSAAMIAALKQLGFAGVGETALGAQEISAAAAAVMQNEAKGLFLSSACPVAVDYIRKYMPEYADDIMPLKSPALAHAEILREAFGKDIGVVLISPCIAKKHEADFSNGVLDLAITYPELRRWMDDAGIDFTQLSPSSDDVFVPKDSEEGRLYPIEGGMFETIRRHVGTENIRGITLSGIPSIVRAFAHLKVEDIVDPVFVELLACDGGCVNGPCLQPQVAGLLGRLKVQRHSVMPTQALTRQAVVNVAQSWSKLVGSAPESSEQQIREALQRVGKQTVEDELNCSGCGYESCREFARALVAGKAETAMCVSYLRKQAQKKANALLRCMPSGVVIVGSDLKIIECNRRFVELFDENTSLAFEARPGMSGALLRKIVPFSDLFDAVLRTGADIHRDSLRVGNRLLNVTIFNIDMHQTVGAVIADVTSTESRREQIALRAREVIEKNLATVQEIACMLGEHMADTEILLRDIADDYADQ